MDVRELILKKLTEKGSLKASEIVRLTGFTRTYVNRFFQELRDEGRLVLIGRANRAHYVPALKEAVEGAKKNILNATLNLRNENLNEDAVLADIKKKTGIFTGLKKDVSDILDYAFSEMLNNAIEHSLSENIRVTMERSYGRISFSVKDEGIGIFNNIMRKKKLAGSMEAIQDLLKGKETTASEAHTGEGIFFTSKAGDILVIRGSGKKLIFDNVTEDVFVKNIKKMKGTRINFSVNTRSKKALSGIFRRYTDTSFEFSKTEVTVRLYKTKARHVSRSEARRLVSGLDKFKTVVLDFSGVESIGQGFADEIFRVWKANHPGIAVEAKNANENARFMIKRASEK